MLGLFTREPSAKEFKPLPIPPHESPTEEYRRLAEKLGVGVHVQESVQLEDVLRREMLHAYELAKVSRYMEKITPTGKVWCWKPLRRSDLERGTKAHMTFGYNDKHGRFSAEIYSHPVPYPALLTVEKIEDAMCGSTLKPSFFVSDYTARMPDPFLMVGIAEELQEHEPTGRLWLANPEPCCFVVERWDEPSFR